MPALHPRLLQDGAPADHGERDRLVVVGDVEDLVVEVLQRAPEIIVGDAWVGRQPVRLDLDIGFHARSPNRFSPRRSYGRFSTAALSRSTPQFGLFTLKPW